MAVLHTIAIKCAKVRCNLLGQVKPVYLEQTCSITCLYAVFFFLFCAEMFRWLVSKYEGCPKSSWTRLDYAVS